MDMNYDTQPKVQMEYQIPIKKSVADAESAKQQAWRAMRTLEGWCSEYKAAILMDFIFDRKPEVVVEIGVFGGKSLVPMAFALKMNGHGKVYGIDPWSSFESVQGMDGVNKDWWGSINHDQIFNGLVSKISEYGLRDYVELVRTTSEQATPMGQIDILHIDGNHSEATSYIDVTKWVPYVKQGGLVIFDDINWNTTSKAVQWLDENCVKLTEVSSDNIWGIWIKL